MATRLINARLILPDRVAENGELWFENGRFVAPVGRADQTIDAAGHYVAPGFVDMHVHGGAGADFMDCTADAFETVVAAHARHGTTTIVPTSTVARHEQTLDLPTAVRMATLNADFVLMEENLRVCEVYIVGQRN